MASIPYALVATGVFVALAMVHTHPPPTRLFDRMSGTERLSSHVIQGGATAAFLAAPVVITVEVT